MNNENEIEEINDLSKLLSYLDQQSFVQGAPRFYFRGESTYTRPLIPQLVRSSTLLGKEGMPGLIKKESTRASATFRERNSPTIFDIQSRLLQKLKRYAVHIYLQNNRPWQGEQPSDWEWLCVAQHHGLPTLLSDWTINPLVALYFSSLRSTEDGIFYVMELKDKEYRDSKKLTIRVGQNENEKDFSSITQDDALIIVPLVFTRRIETQSARFVYTGYLGKILLDPQKINSEEYSEYCASNAIDKYKNDPLPWKKITTYRIPSKSKKTILKQLRSSQIHHGTLFPDLDGYSQYLRMGGD